MNLESLPLLVRQKFAIISHHDTISFRIFDFLDIHLKVDGTHNAAPEHLVDKGFESSAIDLCNFVEPVDEWIHGHGTVERAFHGHFLQRFGYLRTEPQNAYGGDSF